MQCSRDKAARSSPDNPLAASLCPTEGFIQPTTKRRQQHLLILLLLLLLLLG